MPALAEEDAGVQADPDASVDREHRPRERALLAGERSKRKLAPITPYGAILLWYEFFLARDPDSLAPALQALRQVVEAEPDCGPAWTRLARVCLANHAFEVTTIPTRVDDAITYAHNGVRVDLSSSSARGGGGLYFAGLESASSQAA